MAASSRPASASQEEFTPPGTFLLVKESEHDGIVSAERVVVLDPVPSADPNEPLNWSIKRKAVNLTLALTVTCLIFTALSVQVLFWQYMVVDMPVNYNQLNWAVSANNAGLAVGCMFFVPMARKYGRRPTYLISTALMLATSFWSAEMKSVWELYVTNVIQGLAGATNEAIVQITISDLFFVHQRGTMNGLYMTMMMTGSFLTPMAAGTQATNQSWRWSYRTMGIINAIVLLLFIFFYEETKYIPVIDGINTAPSNADTFDDRPRNDTKKATKDSTTELSGQPPAKFQPTTEQRELDLSIPMNPLKKRFALFTPSPVPVWPFVYRPFIILLMFPAVLFTGMQYACGVAWLTIMVSIQSMVYAYPPYNMSAEKIGFLGVAPFIGSLVGVVYGGYFGDRSILYYARKNRGYYEPEMRLYNLHIPALCQAGGLIMFGACTDRGLHWIWPTIGTGIFAFGLGSISDAALTLVIDSYREITGDAFTGIVFLRNAVSVGVPFGITPWMERDGLTNMFIICGFISLAVSCTYIPLAIYGKRVRT